MRTKMLWAPIIIISNPTNPTSQGLVSMEVEVILSRRSEAAATDNTSTQWPAEPTKNVSLFPFNISFSVFQMYYSPGPGKYNLQRQNSISSEKKGAPVIKKDINPNATATSRIPFKIGPGPGHYQYDLNFMDAASTFIDTRKLTLRGSKFSESKRKVFDASKQFTPGPGSYMAPSNFGQYVSKHANSRYSPQSSISHSDRSSLKQSSMFPRVHRPGS